MSDEKLKLSYGFSFCFRWNVTVSVYVSDECYCFSLCFRGRFSDAEKTKFVPERLGDEN